MWLHCTTLPACRIVAVLVVMVRAEWPAAAQERATPKYGPHAIRLFDSREFLRQQPAVDFWALAPYYISQPGDASCSAASASMAINALRAHRQLTADQPLATPESVLDAVPAADWKDKLRADGPGVTLDELAALIPQVARQFDLADIRVEAFRFEGEPQAALEKLRNVLARNEQTDQDLLLVNFLQSTLTSDPEGAVGHMAPVAAYDAGRDRVLILDPDRRWYEPYWTPTERLLAAMNTFDPAAGKVRGLIRVARDGAAPRTTSP